MTKKGSLIVLSLLSAIPLLGTGTSAMAQVGIAKKYPHDKGISSDPDVLFASGFESKFTGWTSVPSQATIETDPTVVHRGKASLKITATKGVDQGGTVSYKFSGQKQIFLRFYTKFHKDTIMPHHFVKIRAIKSGFWPNAGQKPPGGSGFWTGLEPTQKLIWHFYTYWHEMHSWQTVAGLPDGRPNPYYGNGFTPAGQSAIVRDVWICAEAMLKANTVGQYDGEQAFWIAGKKVGHYRKGEPVGNWVRDGFVSWGPYFKPSTAKPFEGYNWRTSSSLQINEVFLQWYQSSSHVASWPATYNIVYFDDVVVAKKYIGCRHEGSSGSDAAVGDANVGDANVGDASVGDVRVSDANTPASDATRSADAAGRSPIADGCSIVEIPSSGPQGAASLAVMLLCILLLRIRR